MFDLPPQLVSALLVSTGALVILLIVSFVSRPRVFTQYLKTMTGITLKPADVARAFRDRGQSGVRDMFLELIIREDLRGGPRITPDSKPDAAMLAPHEERVEQ